ncbi:alpha/beta fold hydrolase [Actinosynnema sp. NPDC059797]
MTPVRATVVEGPTGTPPAVFLHGVLSWGDDEVYGFGNQRPLAAGRRLLLVDRRGYGDSPDLDGPHRSDYEVDAEDVIPLLGDGAHLVGHSYGAVAAMLAASARPDLVRSLCLVQPGALRPAEDHPVVAEALARARAATAAPLDLGPEDYLRLSTGAVGMPAPEPTPKRLRAARTTMGERPCWDADVPLAPLADAGWPVLVVLGDWEGAPEPYRRLAGEPLIAAGREIARRVGAELLTLPGYYPHVQRAAEVNAALEALWAGAERRTG